MGWYDFFSRFYDRSLEPLYLDSRAAAAEALNASPGMSVLDLPCGTGLSLAVLRKAVGAEGRVVGMDASRGMLAKAATRVEAEGLGEVDLLQREVQSIEARALLEALGLEAGFDRVHVFLGMTAFPDPADAFERLWGLLRPGGRFVIADVYAEKPGFQGKMVNLVARADIRRRVWEPLEAHAEGYERRDLPSLPEHGGQLFIASGTKGAANGSGSPGIS